MTREVELKSVVDDVEARRRRLETAGARIVFEGRLEDRRYDTTDRRLSAGDQVLRLRTLRPAGADADFRVALEWKGPARQDGGYKVRDEITTYVTDAAPMAAILERLGYTVTGEIDRRIIQYALGDAVIRFEHYARMDALVEVEGPPDAIERAVDALGMDRAGFTADRLPAFMARFERRTGTSAIVRGEEDAPGGEATTDG